jgi:DNA-directed RNA polymerase subunit RPC12/RpoP
MRSTDKTWICGFCGDVIDLDHDKYIEDDDYLFCSLSCLSKFAKAEEKELVYIECRDCSSKWVFKPCSEDNYICYSCKSLNVRIIEDDSNEEKKE